VIIGVTDEAPNLVDDFVRQYKPEFPIVILKNPEFEKALNVQGFPSAAVIDPAGILQYAGFLGGLPGPLSKALESAKPGPVYPKKLEAVGKSLKAREFGKALADLKKLSGLAAPEQKWADRFLAYLEEQAETALQDARKLVDEGKVYEAVKRAAPFAKAPVPFQATPAVQQMLKELEADPNYKKEVAGGEPFLKASEKEREHAYSEAVQGYLDVAKRFPGTKIGDTAKKSAKSLVDRGLPGFKDACDACVRGKKACAKHQENVKL